MITTLSKDVPDRGASGSASVQGCNMPRPLPLGSPVLSPSRQVPFTTRHPSPLPGSRPSQRDARHPPDTQISAQGVRLAQQHSWDHIRIHPTDEDSATPEVSTQPVGEVHPSALACRPWASSTPCFPHPAPDTALPAPHPVPSGIAAAVVRAKPTRPHEEENQIRRRSWVACS